MTNRTAVAVLTEARQLIEDRANWTQGYFARNAMGFGTDALRPDAVRWCLAGACAKAGGETPDITTQRQFLESIVAAAKALAYDKLGELLVHFGVAKDLVQADKALGCDRLGASDVRIDYATVLPLVIWINDNNDHGDVLAVLDEAIAYARAHYGADE